MAKTITMPDFMTDEEMAALESGNIPIQNVPDFISDDEMMSLEQPEQQKGLIQRGLEYAGKTITGAFQHPIETVKGLGYGAAKSIAGTATDFAAMVNPDDNEDINMTMPGRFPMQAQITNESSFDILKRRENLASQAVTPITENLTPQESRAAKIGELLVPASAGEIALGKPVGVLIGKTIKAGAKLLPKATTEGTELIAEKIMNIAKKEDGSIDLEKTNIPDIDEVDAYELSNFKAGDPSNRILTRKEVNKISEANKAKSAFGVDEGEAQVLSIPKSEKAAPFTDYAVQARKSLRRVDSNGNPVDTPMDLVGKRGVEAFDSVKKIRQSIGKQKSDYLMKIDDAVVANGDFILPDNIKNIWKEKLNNVLGLYVDENGIMKAAASGAKNESLISDARKINTMIDRLPREITAEQLDSFSSNLNGYLTKRTQGQLKPKSDQIDLIVGELKNTINNEIEEKASTLLEKSDFDNYLKSRKNYANTLKIEDELSRSLGREVVPGSDVPARGASIMKRAVQSNADAGSKTLFKAVRDMTGIDLIQEANYADIAMRAVGDPRMNNLLESVGLLKMSKPAIAFKAAEKIVDKVTGSKLDKLINYYNKSQGSSLKNIRTK